MTSSGFPDGCRLEALRKNHPRNSFRSGVAEVDDWIASKALQNQEKRLSATKALIGPDDSIVGYFTLSTGQADFGDLPPELMKRLPKRQLPVAVLAWLGVAADRQGQGIGSRLLARALRDCHEAGRVFPFIAVVLDCIGDTAKAFYKKWDFAELPGHPYKLYLSAAQLEALMSGA